MSNENRKIVWLKVDRKTEIELLDTPNLTKKAESLGWKKKVNK